MQRDELERAGRRRPDPLDLGDHGAARRFGRQPIERGRRVARIQHAMLVTSFGFERLRAAAIMPAPESVKRLGA